MSEFSVGNRLWLNKNGQTYLGEGRVALMKAIQEHGSINSACKSMNMSYKKAWRLIESVNSLSEEPLVIRTTGGSGGGGTIVTKAGQDAIELYERINERCKKFLENELESSAS